MLCLIYMHSPSSVMRIYQAKHSCLCYNLYFYPTEVTLQRILLGAYSTYSMGVYLTYTPSHRVLIHLKGLTVNLQVIGNCNIKRTIGLWDRRKLNPTCIHRISLISYSWWGLPNTYIHNRAEQLINLIDTHDY